MQQVKDASGNDVGMWQNMVHFLKSVRISEYWTYPGPLTTPHCSEAVTWMVFQKHLVMTTSVVRTFLLYIKNIKTTPQYPRQGY